MLGSLAGAGVNFGAQMIEDLSKGWPITNINWTEVLVAAGVGGVVGAIAFGLASICIFCSPAAAVAAAGLAGAAAAVGVFAAMGGAPAYHAPQPQPPPPPPQPQPPSGYYYSPSGILVPNGPPPGAATGGVTPPPPPPPASAGGSAGGDWWHGFNNRTEPFRRGTATWFKQLISFYKAINSGFAAGMISVFAGNSFFSAAVIFSFVAAVASQQLSGLVLGNGLISTLLGAGVGTAVSIAVNYRVSVL